MGKQQCTEACPGSVDTYLILTSKYGVNVERFVSLEAGMLSVDMFFPSMNERCSPLITRLSYASCHSVKKIELQLYQK